MDIKGQIEGRILEAHRLRSRHVYLPNLIVIFFATYIQREELTRLDYWWHPIAIIILALVLRFLNLEILSRAWLAGHSASKALNLFTMGLGGLGWGYHFCNVFEAYGVGSPHVSYALLIVAGMIASATTSLSAIRSSYFTYVTSITLVAAYPYMQTFEQDGQFALVNISLFYIYNVSNYRTAHKELKRMVEIELMSSFERNRFRRLIDAVPGFVSIINRDKIYVDANSAMLAVFPGILGKKLGFRSSASLEMVEKFIASTKQSEVSEFEMSAGEKQSHFLISMQRTEHDGVVIISLPMEELVTARKELRAQEAKAQYSAKLASLGEMAAGIAHEVNNPLTIIQGSAMVISRMANETPVDLVGIKALIERMVITTDRIAKIIRSLKSLSRNGDNDPMRPVDLTELLSQCLDICRQRMNSYDIELILPDMKMMEDIVVTGRDVQLSQVIVNLLSNASDAVKDLPVRKIEIALEKSDSQLDILFKDSGRGVPLEIRSRIMDPFFTTKEVNQGTGLGLSISKTIMQEHDGELSFLPEEKMTTFRMRLPMKTKQRPVILAKDA